MTEQSQGPKDMRTVKEVLNDADSRYLARQVASGYDNSHASQSNVKQQLKQGNDFSWRGVQEGHWSNPDGPTQGMPPEDNS